MSVDNERSGTPGSQSVVDKLVQYLQYEKDEGRTHVEILPAKERDVGGNGVHLQQATAVDTKAEVGRIAREVEACKKCPLHAGRTHTVPGQGSTSPEIMFIGEAPGHEEDVQGLAFVGRAAPFPRQLLHS